MGKRYDRIEGRHFKQLLILKSDTFAEWFMDYFESHLNEKKREGTLVRVAVPRQKDALTIRNFSNAIE